METSFDTPERKNDKDVKSLREQILTSDFFVTFFDLLPQSAILLSEDRQILLSSSGVNETIKQIVQDDITGLRLGEAIGCIYSKEMEGGCGTSKYCSTCGAGQAIKSTKDTNLPCSKECRITANVEGKEFHYDFKVSTKLFRFNKERLIVVFLENIEDQKKREMLERIFFHDLMNISNAISGLSNLCREVEGEEQKEVTKHLTIASTNLINEISAQRGLLEAEKGILTPNFRPVKINHILEEVYSIYKNLKMSAGKKLVVKKLSKSIEIITDKEIVLRSLGNIVKNALEATNKGDEIKIYAKLTDDKVILNVKNQGVIPEEIQLQIFQRSFSTKSDHGRGIGTYSVKLLIGQYLNGKVRFISNPEMQTVFSIELPL